MWVLFAESPQAKILVDYRTLSEADKIKHLEAYSAALHQVKNRCTILLVENYVLKKRLEALSGVKEPCLKAS